MTKTRMACRNCGGDIGDVVCDDGGTFNKCRNCGHMQNRHSRKVRLSDEKREALEKLVQRLVAA